MLCLMVFRVSAVDGSSYVPWKFPMNMAHSWPHEVIDPSGKWMSYDLVASVNAVGRKLASTQSSPPSDLNNGLIHLNKFLRVARAVILVDVASLEFVWPPDLFEWSRQSTESTLSHRSSVLC
jgi:hypothetical protein